VKVKPPQPAADEELSKLLLARYKSATVVVDARFQRFIAGRERVESVVESLRMLRDAWVALSDKPADQVAIYELCFDLAKEIAEISEARCEAGRMTIQDCETARYTRLDTEIQLLSLKRKLKQPSPK
jgi:hypothetical protein